MMASRSTRDLRNTKLGDIQPAAPIEPGSRTRSWASSAAIRRTMQGCRGRDTSTELALRSAVHALGLRYRVDVRPVATVRRKADLVFAREHLAVFLDGCDLTPENWSTWYEGSPAH
jgi:DNA mismatch endonuclease (patch repair protein)